MACEDSSTSLVCLEGIGLLTGYDQVEEDLFAYNYDYDSGLGIHGYNTTVNDTSSSTSGVNITTITPTVAPVEYPDPFTYLSSYVDRVLNRGWNTTARSVNPLVAGGYFEFTCMDGIEGCFMGIGIENQDGNLLQQFSHAMIVGTEGVKVMEHGSIVATMTSSHNAAAVYRIYRLSDNRVVYVVSHEGVPIEGTPSTSPSSSASASPSATGSASASPSGSPSSSPSSTPSSSPSASASGSPSASPSDGTPSSSPSASPSEGTPSSSPSEGTPSSTPSASPSEATPSTSPSGSPSATGSASTSPSASPSSSPSSSPSASPSSSASASPSPYIEPDSVTLVYISRTPLPMGTPFDAYVYGYLYTSGDQVTDASLATGGVGIGQVTMTGSATLTVDTGAVLLQGSSSLLAGIQTGVGTATMSGSGIFFAHGTGGRTIDGYLPEVAGLLVAAGVSGYGAIDADIGAIDGALEAYAYAPPPATTIYGEIGPIDGALTLTTTFHADLDGSIGALAFSGGEGTFGMVDGSIGAIEGAAKADFNPGYAPLFERMIILDGMKGEADLIVIVNNNMEITGTITASRVLIEQFLEDATITGSITVLGDYLASALEDLIIDFAVTGQVSLPVSSSNPLDDVDTGGGYYIDTDGDGTDDIYITTTPTEVDSDGDGVSDEYAITVVVNVDTDGDGTQDAWIGGPNYIDEDTVTEDPDNNQIMIDTDGDGTPDTYQTGGEYYDTDGDGTDDLWLPDGATYIDADGDGTDDTWAIGIGVNTDTDDDGVQDTWIWGQINIVNRDEIVTTRPSVDSGRRVWVVNLEGGAPYQYDDYGFNSFFEKDGVYYGVAEDGIYQLDGDDDAGVPIEALIEMPLSDMGTRQKSGVTNVYVGATSDGKLLLKVQMDGGTEYTYEARSSSATIGRHRFDTGKGLVGNYVKFTLLNQDGDDFDIESISFDPIATKRKI